MGNSHLLSLPVVQVQTHSNRKNSTILHLVHFLTGVSLIAKSASKSDSSVFVTKVVSMSSSIPTQVFVDPVSDAHLVTEVTGDFSAMVSSYGGRSTCESMRSFNASLSASTTVNLPATGDGAMTHVESAATLDIGIASITPSRSRSTKRQSRRQVG